MIRAVKRLSQHGNMVVKRHKVNAVYKMNGVC